MSSRDLQSAFVTGGISAVSFALDGMPLLLVWIVSASSSGSWQGVRGHERHEAVRDLTATIRECKRAGLVYTPGRKHMEDHRSAIAPLRYHQQHAVLPARGEERPA